MPAQVSIATIARGAVNGIVKAQRACEKWSGGEWLWCAPEYIATVFVAQEISKLDGSKYVTVEHGANAAIADAGARGRGKLHHKIRANGRFDILLWWADETPRAPIEVKCQVTKIDKIKADLQRIGRVINQRKEDSSFQFGVVVFYSSCKDGKVLTAKERLTSQLLNINTGCKELLPRCTVKMSSSKIYTDGDSAWVASAIVLQPTK
ncbi:MAG: hypothetical protein WCI39_13495 [Gallionellaceae bacterium]